MAEFDVFQVEKGFHVVRVAISEATRYRKESELIERVFPKTRFAGEVGGAVLCTHNIFDSTNAQVSNILAGE